MAAYKILVDLLKSNLPQNRKVKEEMKRGEVGGERRMERIEERMEGEDRREREGWGWRRGCSRGRRSDHFY